MYRHFKNELERELQGLRMSAETGLQTSLIKKTTNSILRKQLPFPTFSDSHLPWCSVEKLCPVGNVRAWKTTSGLISQSEHVMQGDSLQSSPVCPFLCVLFIRAGSIQLFQNRY